MMTKATFTVLLTGFAGAAQAQHNGVTLGLKAGGSLTDIVGADAGFYKNLFGFHAGGFANIGLGKTLAFQPELLYSQKGAKSPLLFGDADATTRFHYLDIPLAFQVRADGFFFEAGPQVGFFLLGQEKVFGSTSSISQGNYNFVDVGYLAGLGYNHESGLGIGLRYNGEFTNVRRPFEFGSSTFPVKARNSALQLYLSYAVNRHQAPQ